MKIAIMQPYFFPYIGYFQLINAVDEFIVYDNIEYSRKGWVNRNRILVGGADSYITLPLKKDSDYLNIVERSLADIWLTEREKMLNKLRESYRSAPSFKHVFPMLEELLKSEETNLFKFLIKSLEGIKEYLEITTPFVTSSTIKINHDLKAEDKVIELIRNRNADVYINPIGGLELYSKSRFKEDGIELHFLQAKNIKYQQFSNEFVPFLSFIDVMMFNSQQEVKNYLNEYTLV
ncbi:MAG: WbqC family protein [Chryseolinea sp.]